MMRISGPREIRVEARPPFARQPEQSAKSEGVEDYPESLSMDLGSGVKPSPKGLQAPG